VQTARVESKAMKDSLPKAHFQSMTRPIDAKNQQIGLQVPGFTQSSGKKVSTNVLRVIII
jgi:hypothetical protein